MFGRRKNIVTKTGFSLHYNNWEDHSIRMVGCLGRKKVDVDDMKQEESPWSWGGSDVLYSPELKPLETMWSTLANF